MVTSANGPEAGVWVIAQTSDLPTKFVKIVVTDDQGRYVLPELPKANYDIWVRGYGLVDSPKVKGEPGKALDLKAMVAPNDAAAAEYYPAQYWYSMLKIPDKSLFPGKGDGPGGNGMSEKVKSQGQWLSTLKTHACNSCHQLGNKPTRTIEKELGQFNSSYDAWFHRVHFLSYFFVSFRFVSFRFVGSFIICCVCRIKLHSSSKQPIVTSLCSLVVPWTPKNSFTMSTMNIVSVTPVTSSTSSASGYLRLWVSQVPIARWRRSRTIRRASLKLG